MRVFIYASLIIFVAAVCCSAQQNPTASANASISGMKSTESPERQAQLDSLRRARQAMADYLATVPPDSEDFHNAKTTITELDSKLKKLTATAKHASTRPAVAPEFSLSVPATGRTNIALEPTLVWTEDRRNESFKEKPRYVLKKFRVVVAKDPEFKQIAFRNKEVVPRSEKVTPDKDRAPKGIQSVATSCAIPPDKLESGTVYYWKVIAVYADPDDPDTEFDTESEADPATQEQHTSVFITALDPFAPLTKRGFSLQRSLAAKGPSEGAQFSFLKTFDKNTVYSADFAFFWDSRAKPFANGHGSVKFRPAVEGKLTSDNTRAEDAWRFVGSAVLDYSFIETKADEQNRVTTGTGLEASQPFIDSLYFELGGSLESDQGFDTKKVASRVFFSPSSRKLAMGTATGEVLSPVQFFWRPSVEFNAGHTFEVGDSAEVGSTVLRVMPRVRMTLLTQGLTRLLKVANTDFFLDNTFYYLPKEKFKTKHNFFTAGFEVFVVKNFGFGLTYKNGESAPRFRPIRSFGGTLIVGFGSSR